MLMCRESIDVQFLGPAGGFLARRPCLDKAAATRQRVPTGLTP
jgi:hypothetical protein